MKDLVSLVEHYSPHFSKGVQPATEDAIRSLEYLAGPLPGAYLRLLRTLGGSPNPLQLNNLDLSIQVALRLRSAKKHLRFTTRYTFFAAELDDIRRSSTGWTVTHPSVMTTARSCCPDFTVYAEEPASPTYEPCAASLEDFLYFRVFADRVVPSFEHSQWGYLPEYHGPDEVDLALLVPLTLGFTRRPRPLHNAIFERDGAAIAIRRDPDGFVGIYLAAHDKDELDALAAAFSASSGYGTGFRRG
jgi:hypothetical protein